ncbi:Zinc finger BED domain-containing protein RICESLEEPER 4 [Bienertia sinuspersici]
MVSVMLEKFEKYWGHYFMLSAIAIVLDPWYKMVLVGSAFSKLYVPDSDSSYVSIGDAQSNVDAYLNSPLMTHN